MAMGIPNLEFSKLALVDRFFSGTGHSYDRIVNLCTFCCDLWWKGRILRAIPKGSTRIIDQACGTGILTFKIARRFPDCEVVGVELRDEYLGLAREKSRRMNVKKVDFVLGRAEDVLIRGPVDCITSSYLAKYAEFDTLIPNALHMLRPGGRLIMHDFTYPTGRFFPRLWVFYFRILQTLASRVYPEWKTVFHELPGFLKKTPWVSELLPVLKKNDFANIRTVPLTFGTSTMVTATKRSLQRSWSRGPGF